MPIAAGFSLERTRHKKSAIRGWPVQFVPEPRVLIQNRQPRPSSAPPRSGTAHDSGPVRQVWGQMMQPQETPPLWVLLTLVLIIVSAGMYLTTYLVIEDSRVAVNAETSLFARGLK